jgi:hypothetical protein
MGIRAFIVEKKNTAIPKSADCPNLHGQHDLRLKQKLPQRNELD